VRPALLTLGVIAAAAIGGCGFGGDEAPMPGAALTPPESSWLPGQKPLVAYPRFAAVFDRAVELARGRRKQRELALERIAREKLAAKKREEADARRRYLEARRRAQRLYRQALREAARKRREQEERLRRIKERIAEQRRKREEKLKIRPGEECKLPGVRERYDCKTGRLPDPATDGKRRRK
jgi:hypothetical protein